MAGFCGAAMNIRVYRKIENILASLGITLYRGKI